MAFCKFLEKEKVVGENIHSAEVFLLYLPFALGIVCSLSKFRETHKYASYFHFSTFFKEFFCLSFYGS